tara:strand:+ start:60 stop:455 length:396 start_codon:yes stop_codon:yes gene_type:complete
MKRLLLIVLPLILILGCSGDSSSKKSTIKTKSENGNSNSSSASSSSNSSSYSSNKKISSSEAKRLAEKYIDRNSLLHGHMGLDYYSNFSNPNNGVFTFYGAVCYGSSEYDCNYQSVYLITKDYGKTWSVDF